jgi:hypothetical protein
MAPKLTPSEKQHIDGLRQASPLFRLSRDPAWQAAAVALVRRAGLGPLIPHGQTAGGFITKALLDLANASDRELCRMLGYPQGTPRETMLTELVQLAPERGVRNARELGQGLQKLRDMELQTRLGVEMAAHEIEARRRSGKGEDAIPPISEHARDAVEDHKARRDLIRSQVVAAERVPHRTKSAPNCSTTCPARCGTGPSSTGPACRRRPPTSCGSWWASIRR